MDGRDRATGRHALRGGVGGGRSALGSTRPEARRGVLPLEGRAGRLGGRTRHRRAATPAPGRRRGARTRPTLFRDRRGCGADSLGPLPSVDAGSHGARVPRRCARQPRRGYPGLLSAGALRVSRRRATQEARTPAIGVPTSRVTASNGLTSTAKTHRNDSTTNAPNPTAYVATSAR